MSINQSESQPTDAPTDAPTYTRYVDYPGARLFEQVTITAGPFYSATYKTMQEMQIVS